MRAGPTRAAWTIAAIYATVGVIWILNSDAWVGAVRPDPDWITEAQTLKGLLFVFATASGLFLLMRRQLAAMERSRREALSRAEELRAIVAEKERTEVALHASQRRFRSLVECVPEVISELDGAGVFRYVNPSCQRVLGWDSDELVGKPIGDYLHSEDARAALATLADAMREPGVVRSVHTRFLHRDGSWRILEGVGVAVEDEAGALTVVINSHDITEQILRERRLAVDARWARMTDAVAAAMAHGASLSEASERCCRALEDGFDLATVQLWTTDERDESLELQATVGLAGPAGPGRVRVADPRSPIARAARTGCLVLDPEEGGDGARERPPAFAAQPFFAGDRRLGVVAAWRSRPLDGREIEALEATTDRLATALQQRRSQSAAIEQRRLLESVIATIPHHVFWKDAQLRYLGCNDQFARVAGLASPREIVGQTDYDMAWSREQADFFRACDRRVIETGQPMLDIEEPQLRADGTEATLLTSKVPLRDAAGRVTGVLGVYTDITDRKHEERKLRRLVTAVEQASEAMVVTDREGRIAYVNPAFTRITGYAREEVLGQRPSLLKSGKHDARFYEELWTTILGGETWAGRLVNRRKDGRLYEEEMTISPVRDDAGQIVSFVAVKRDVTERVALEAQLRQAQRLESVGALAAGVAHEINTPIQYVGDNIRFLQQAFGELQQWIDRPAGPATDAALQAELAYLREEIPRAVEQSLDGVQRVTSIVRAMKEFCHPAQDKQAVDINHAIETTLTVARNEWKYVAEVATELDPDLPPVHCLPNEINQVILNLVVNAAHAIADAGREGKGRITVRTRRLEDGVEIRVEDTGTGIPDAIRSRIFDPFFTTKAVGQGTGQGLNLAHMVVVRKHGGTIVVESEVGAGSCFTVRLPFGHPAAVPEEIVA